MFPQPKILVPIIIEESYTDLHFRLMVMVGVTISVFFSGILVTLGITSLKLFMLSSKRELLSRQAHFLVAYTTILLFLVVVFEVQVFIACNAQIIFFQSPGRAVEATRVLLSISTVILAVMWGLTDGLLVSMWWHPSSLHPSLTINSRFGGAFWFTQYWDLTRQSGETSSGSFQLVYGV